MWSTDVKSEPPLPLPRVSLHRLVKSQTKDHRAVNAFDSKSEKRILN